MRLDNDGRKRLNPGRGRNVCGLWKEHSTGGRNIRRGKQSHKLHIWRGLAENIFMSANEKREGLYYYRQ